MENKTQKINKPKKCQEKRYDDSPCNRPLYDDKHCIFHSENIEQKKDDFKKAFWEEFERQKKEDKCYDFSSFIFPDSISFDEIKFDKDVYFDGAQFTGEKTSFLEAEFKSKKTSFSRVKFKGKVTYFDEAKFNAEDISFRGAEFTGEITSFYSAKFTGEETSFFGAKFTGKEISFTRAQFTGENNSFREAKFTGENTFFIETEFTGKETHFFGAKFKSEEITFFGAKFSGNKTDFSWTQFTGKKTSFLEAQFTGNETSFEETRFIGEETDFSWATFTCEVTLYRAIFKNVLDLFESLVKERKWLFLKTKKYLIKDWRFYLQPETANRHPLVNRLVNDAWYLDAFKTRYPISYFFWKILANCGRSMLLWAAWAMGIALLFGVIFMYIGPEAFDLRHVPTKFSFFYYSIVTFTTLGFGDITPKTLTTEILVTIEVILGYIMLGGLISIFANKLARRS